ncbi:hypothetical protein B0T17DRAFT_20362 [Bombardia bombarda]|uniref:Uncharacterized protein n=1 Tax=Bombardia bombarda TaxID=252184 RepID=A0AA40CE33_9PEZI|nr:hypothetical protein B0T17DRAFT_20362 [Bombardia bombarda]
MRACSSPKVEVPLANLSYAVPIPPSRCSLAWFQSESWLSPISSLNRTRCAHPSSSNHPFRNGPTSHSTSGFFYLCPRHYLFAPLLRLTIVPPSPTNGVPGKTCLLPPSSSRLSPPIQTVIVASRHMHLVPFSEQSKLTCRPIRAFPPWPLVPRITPSPLPSAPPCLSVPHGERVGERSATMETRPTSPPSCPSRPISSRPQAGSWRGSTNYVVLSYPVEPVMLSVLGSRRPRKGIKGVAFDGSTSSSSSSFLITFSAPQALLPSPPDPLFAHSLQPTAHQPSTLPQVILFVH